MPGRWCRPLQGGWRSAHRARSLGVMVDYGRFIWQLVGVLAM